MKCRSYWLIIEFTTEAQNRVLIAAFLSRYGDLEPRPFTALNDFAIPVWLWHSYISHNYDQPRLVHDLPLCQTAIRCDLPGHERLGACSWMKYQYTNRCHVRAEHKSPVQHLYSIGDISLITSGTQFC